jgi:branched-subunit amino acid aminotransferase/4-amino-4-deoxychorismate lyase
MRAFSSTAARRGVHSFCSVNGVPVDAAAASCSIWDVTFQRGDGVFEAMRVLPAKGGRPAHPRASHLNLDRLERSAAGIRMPLPPRAELARWLFDAAAATGDGYLRLMATRGTAQGYGDHLGAALEDAAPPKVFIVWQPIPARVESVSLFPTVAPWHPAGFSDDWEVKRDEIRAFSLSTAYVVTEEVM